MAQSSSDFAPFVAPAAKPSRAPAPAPAPTASDVTVGKQSPIQASPAPGARAPAPALVPVSPRPSSVAITGGAGTAHGKQRIRTAVTKDATYGIGLDLAKTPTGGCAVQRLKEMPDGVLNPAAQCNPSILAGDAIVAVNGQPCGAFSDAVKALRAATGTIELTLERG